MVKVVLVAVVLATHIYMEQTYLDLVFNLINIPSTYHQHTINTMSSADVLQEAAAAFAHEATTHPSGIAPLLETLLKTMHGMQDIDIALSPPIQRSLPHHSQHTQPSHLSAPL